MTDDDLCFDQDVLFPTPDYSVAAPDARAGAWLKSISTDRSGCGPGAAGRPTLDTDDVDVAERTNRERTSHERPKSRRPKRAAHGWTEPAPQ